MSAVSILALVATLSSPPLTPGMAAPKLQVAGWLKSAAPKADNRHLRVVEFWATWCGPCKASIPHLTELAHRYRGRVDFVGVSVWERPTTTLQDLKRFVAGFGARMDYRVAYDKADQTIAKTWLTAAGQTAIPTSFLVDGDGMILWIGHPDHLEPVIGQALSGVLNVSKAKQAFLEDSAREAHRKEDRETALHQAAAIGERYMAGEFERADADFDALAAESPEKSEMVVLARLMVYRYAYGKGRYETAERSWKALATRSPALRDRIDENRNYAYSDRYRSGDPTGAEKAWADLMVTASPKGVVTIEEERLRAYANDPAKRQALVEKMLAGSQAEREAAERFLKAQGSRTGIRSGETS